MKYYLIMLCLKNLQDLKSTHPLHAFLSLFCTVQNKHEKTKV